MNQDTFIDLTIKITEELSALNANMKNVLDKIADHEKRIYDLEKGCGKTTIHDIKDTIIMWLVKGTVVAFITIGSLTGASALIQKVLGH